ncbi:transmembrane and ubiquitin-like domain-containing protein 1 [Cephus cinctus]|uniref:Transmembrane and ubiquitin-like domain-containing protein 1 n=1 Tax=Cephus cinctus TaxID=211228 RepID=A0AAJ7FG68_CEPCN|nr:transmembrane and ubiquitin-like domain-containing protein 1 [Cephus cinctus]XP_015590245.1 transmembrane and ubiquitin-like domain-containing protein 1 [Cephus cinctus]XP_024938239.1 transmembrane and ubiquitin-like domain-containing protein 1 [Cephus cinctus]
MSYIEGVGDEVTDFFIIVGVLLVGWLAWRSTNIADQPLIRTVLILQHRTRTRIAELRANHQSVDSSSRPPNLESSLDESAVSNANDNNTMEIQCPMPSSVTATENMPIQSDTTATAATSEDVLIEAMDSFNNEDSGLRHRTPKITTSETTTNITEAASTITECTNEESSSIDGNQISIKLKFINEDQKMVTGSLKELLGDFKRRHFQIELESQKLVRLVFNGQVLQPDSQTLERCGLYNNCVVHCLVHQPRPASIPPSQTTSSENSSPLYFNPQPFQDIPAGAGLSVVRAEWDLSRLLVSILTLILGLAWYSRYHYAQLFTATTTLALYGLTAIFTVSLFGHFFPDRDSIRNLE